MNTVYGGASLVIFNTIAGLYYRHNFGFTPVLFYHPYMYPDNQVGMAK